MARFRYIPGPGTWVLIAGLLLSLGIGLWGAPTWVEQKTVYQVHSNAEGQLVYESRGALMPLPERPVPYAQSPLRQAALDTLVDASPALPRQWVIEPGEPRTQDQAQYALLQANFHFGPWSLLPALLTIALCVITREPLTALLGGIVSGALLLQRYDLSGEVIIPALADPGTAAILLLYLWLLGGLLGVWARTGAAQAFADYMTRRFVRGPRSARLVAWGLGVFFFQGGSISTVLVGTTVRPLADKEGVSHEELSYIVDSTASPIASLLAFNAWPAYVQALIYMPGVAFLATEADRIAFFFRSVPFSFYSIFAVLGTLLLSLGVTRFSGGPMRRAVSRAQETGALDAPEAKPMAAPELHVTRVPEHYTPRVFEFLVPILLIVVVAVATFALTGTPNVHWGFGFGLLFAGASALMRGMTLEDLISGIGDGLKGIVLASVILMMAITIGGISKEVGGGIYLVELLGGNLPFWLLPVCLQALTMAAAFSTGSSWGTYAIVFPLAMPLAWAIAGNQGLANPELYLAVCFATVLNGSVYGDQCSPISDTTVLSAMTTGCDLMDHVKTQIFPATLAAILAAVGWTGTVLLFA